MAPVRAALDNILAGHAPFPALIVDRRWDVIAANAPALALMSEDVTVAELAIESFFPADSETSAALRGRGLESGEGHRPRRDAAASG
jgi:MmyB-like transcription regulator ligand binding domain